MNWQQVILGEITQKEYLESLEKKDKIYTSLEKSINDYGLEKTLRLRHLDIKEITDPELVKLLDFYETYRNLFLNHIKRESKKENFNQNK